MRKFLLGKRIYLRGLTEVECSSESPYFHWLDDLSLDLFTERSYYPNTPQRMDAYFGRAQLHQDLILLGIFDHETNKHIGNITFTEIDHINRRACIAYLLGDKSFAGKGITTDAVLMMMYYGFNKLNFERIHAGVSSSHLASQRVLEKAGLIVEGRQRHHLFRNGQWHDSLIVGALRGEWTASHGDLARQCFDALPTSPG